MSKPKSKFPSDFRAKNNRRVALIAHRFSEGSITAVETAELKELQAYVDRWTAIVFPPATSRLAKTALAAIVDAMATNQVDGV